MKTKVYKLIYYEGGGFAPHQKHEIRFNFKPLPHWGIEKEDAAIVTKAIHDLEKGVQEYAWSGWER